MKGRDWGQRISTSEEFPHVAIYEAPGPVYTLSFRNREWPSDWAMLPRPLAWTAILFAGIWGMADLPRVLGDWGIPWYVPVGLMLLMMIGATAWLFDVPFVRREIVFDIPGDRIRIYRGRRRTLDRKLSMLKNITIADHPDTELERARRGPGKGPGPLEKQHCLMGWFGAGDTGVNQVILLTRYEFPKIHSLFEVGQAMNWALKRYTSAAPSPGMQFVPADDEQPAKGQGLKPPLD
jgi:hypothetical protein